MIMIPEIFTTVLFVGLLAYILAPYWWRSGWWRIPHGDMVGPLRERVAAIERQIGDLEFEAQSGKITMADLESSRARRALERDRLLRQLDRLGGMVALRPLPPAIQHNRRCEDCGASCVAGTRFCAECGTPLKPRPIPPQGGESAKLARRKIVRLHSMVVAMLLMNGVIAASVAAQESPPMQPPHETMATGTITGLLRVGKEALRNHAYDIVVRMGEQEVVRVARTTDDTGHFIIKNIFPHEALRYFVTVIYQAALLSSPPLQLAPGVDHAEIDVVITAEGMTSATILAGTTGARIGTGPTRSRERVGPVPIRAPVVPQWASGILCGITIVAMGAKIVWYRRRRRTDVA